MASDFTLSGGSVKALTGLANGTFLAVWNGAGNVPMAQTYDFERRRGEEPSRLPPDRMAKN